MRSFLPSVALITAAFLFACQDVGPAGPDGLVPQFAKKDCDADSSHPGCKDDGGGGLAFGQI